MRAEDVRVELRPVDLNDMIETEAKGERAALVLTYPMDDLTFTVEPVEDEEGAQKFIVHLHWPPDTFPLTEPVSVDARM